jgi:Ca2+-transporting ATPase
VCDYTQAIAEVCAVCNEARIECREGTFKAAGAPTEAALVVLAEKLGVPNQAASATLAAARSSDPDNHPDGVQQWYNARSAPSLTGLL